jgi:hypothetical protein
MCLNDVQQELSYREYKQLPWRSDVANYAVVNCTWIWGEVNHRSNDYSDRGETRITDLEFL